MAKNLVKGKNGYCICTNSFSGHNFLFKIGEMYNYQLDLIFDSGNLISEQYLISDSKQPAAVWHSSRLCFSDVKVLSKIQTYRKEEIKMCFKDHFITLAEWREQQINSILND